MEWEFLWWYPRLAPWLQGQRFQNSLGEAVR